MATQNRYVIADGLLANNAVEGTYNVYFTELEDADVDSFADLVADKIDYNSIKNAPNAAAGNYNDAIGEDNYLHPLNKVAFSGNAQDLSGLSTVAVSGDYNDLKNKPSIEDYNLSVSYDEIEGAPGITAGEYADEDGGESVLHDFDKIAFSGEYEDLKHAPALPENAYEKQQIGSTQVLTGNINPFNKAAFGDFSDLSESDYTSNYIIQLPFVETALCESESGSFDFTDNSFFEVAGALYNGFAGGFEAFTTYGKTVYLITENSHMIYILLSTHYIADRVYDFVFTPIFNTNYNSLRELSDDNIVSQLDMANNDLAEKLVVAFDWARTKMYWKIISKNDELATVAFTGDYNDLENTFSESDIRAITTNILDLRGYSGYVSNLTIDENTTNDSKLRNIGRENTYVLGLSSFNNGSLVTNISNFVNQYNNDKAKNYYIVSNIGAFLVTNISTVNDENTHQPIYYQISLLNSNSLNYSNIREEQPNITTEQANNILNSIDTSTNYINNLIIDLENNIIYFKQINNIMMPNLFFNFLMFTTTDNQENNNKILNFGTEDAYILNVDQIIINNQYSLLDSLQQFAQVCKNSGRIGYLNFINDIKQIKNIFINNNYIQIDMILNNKLNYDLIKPNTIDDNNAQNVLNNLNIKSQESIIILDLEQKVIYYKIKQEE